MRTRVHNVPRSHIQSCIHMPTTKNPIERYRILDRCLRDTHRRYTLEALLEALNKQLSYTSGKEVSLRTLQKDLNTLEYEYAVDYDEELRRQRPAIYRYENPNKYYQFVRLTNKDSEKIQEAINVLAAYEGNPQYDWARMLLNEAQMCNEENASGRVEFQNNPDLQGLEHFSTLLDAIIAKQLLNLSYQPYGKEKFVIKFSPIRLKQFNNRWYVIGKCPQYDNISIYPLDRIQGVEVAKGKYEETDIDIDELFDDQVGISITAPGAKVEDVILRITNERYHYIETKPIHWSQTELKEQATEHTRTVRLRVYLNKELTQQLLSFGDDLEVIAPAELRKTLKDKIAAMNEKYQ